MRGKDEEFDSKTSGVNSEASGPVKLNHSHQKDLPKKCSCVDPETNNAVVSISHLMGLARFHNGTERWYMANEKRDHFHHDFVVEMR